MPKEILTKEEIARDAFISRVMVGPCPNCGSHNTHDCGKQEYVPGLKTTTSTQRIEGIEIAKDIMKIGSTCPIALKLDDCTVGHCDDCNYLWCLVCGSELSVEMQKCGHWEICGECGKTSEFPTTCPYKEEAEGGNLIVNPCLLGCIFINECSKCPYDTEWEKCPKIKEWKSNKNRYRGKPSAAPYS